MLRFTAVIEIFFSLAMDGAAGNGDEVSNISGMVLFKT